MSYSCHMLRLPVELLQQIFDYVEKEDLTTLRSTSARVSAAASPRYAAFHCGCTYCNVRDQKALQRVKNLTSVQAFCSKMKCLHFEIGASSADFDGLEESSLTEILRKLQDPWRSVWLNIGQEWYAQDFELVHQIIGTFVAAPYPLASIEMSRSSTETPVRLDSEPLPTLVSEWWPVMSVTARANVKEFLAGEVEGLRLESFTALRSIVARANFLLELHICLEASEEEKAHIDFPRLTGELLLANDFAYLRELTFANLCVEPETLQRGLDACAEKLTQLVLYNAHLLSADMNAWTAVLRSMLEMSQLKMLRMGDFYQRHEARKFKLRFPYSSEGKNKPRRFVSFDSAADVCDGLTLLLARGLQLKPCPS